MPLLKEDILSMLHDHFPGARIEILDLAGDNDHYQLTIESAAFIGKNRVQQHQLVYAALQGKMGTDLHALALTTKTPPA